ncbi:TRAP transporter small permease subunit [Marinobacter sp.]|uniref:TRAP transporter small permease subunit n=1 Tax=Marinobacter sp. TaxID=50741 RepID=UPI003A8CD594
MRAVLSFVLAAEYYTAGFARGGAWLSLITVIVVIVSVIGAALGWNEIAVWDTDILLFGNQLTMTGMGELQWHIFAVLVMFGGLQALQEDAHVRVDFIYQSLKRRQRLAVNLIGHLFLLMPFLFVIIDRSIPSLQLAWLSDSGSDYGGLQDRWIVKAALPIGFLLILVLTIFQAIEMAIRLLYPKLDQEFGEQC